MLRAQLPKIWISVHVKKRTAFGNCSVTYTCNRHPKTLFGGVILQLCRAIIQLCREIVTTSIQLIQRWFQEVKRLQEHLSGTPEWLSFKAKMSLLWTEIKETTALFGGVVLLKFHEILLVWRAIGITTLQFLTSEEMAEYGKSVFPRLTELAIQLFDSDFAPIKPDGVKVNFDSRGEVEDDICPSQSSDFVVNNGKTCRKQSQLCAPEDLETLVNTSLLIFFFLLYTFVIFPLLSSLFSSLIRPKRKSKEETQAPDEIDEHDYDSGSEDWNRGLGARRAGRAW